MQSRRRTGDALLPGHGKKILQHSYFHLLSPDSHHQKYAFKAFYIIKYKYWTLESQGIIIKANKRGTRRRDG
jgi:hypothetical protein